MNRRQAITRRQARGFTVIEVVIVLTLSALLISLVAGNLYVNIRSAEALDRAADTAAGMRAASHFLQTQLRHIMPLHVPAELNDDALFRGEAGRVRFVGRVPGHRAQGEVFVNDIRVGGPPGENRLEYRFGELDSVAVGSGQAVDRVTDYSRYKTILKGIRKARFSYFGRRDDETEIRWSGAWSEAERLPDLVRLSAQLNSGRVVEITTALHAQPQADRRAHALVPAKHDKAAGEADRPGRSGVR